MEKGTLDTQSMRNSDVIPTTYDVTSPFAVTTMLTHVKFNSMNSGQTGPDWEHAGALSLYVKLILPGPDCK